MLEWDPQIRLQAAATERGVPVGNHPRRPDIAMDIRVFIPPRHPWHNRDVEYSGHYVGHGQSKTVFELQGVATEHANDSFHGAVLKLAKTKDMEPYVFQQTYEASVARFSQAVCPRLFYNCMGCEGDRNKYHSWIAEATIPLDEFVRDHRANKKQCTLAAYRCILRAAACGLHLSDCHFFNFGVRVTSDATEHIVVIIDAGSRGMEPAWSKQKMTTKCMKKFWHHARQECADDAEMENHWRANWDCQSCLEWADSKWQAMPRLTWTRIDTQTIKWQISATERRTLVEIKQTGGYKIMKMVGSFACDGQWNESLSRACYRAARCLDVILENAEALIMDELHSRIADNRNENQIHAVMATWAELRRYAEDWPPTGYTSGDMTWQQMREVLSNWVYHVLWHEQTEAQKRVTKKWHSRQEAMLYKKAAWIPAAHAVIQYGFPKLQDATFWYDDTAERINALGDFARDLARWLQRFARGLVAYRDTEAYKKARHASRTPIESWGLTGSSETSRRHLLAHDQWEPGDLCRRYLLEMTDEPTLTRTDSISISSDDL